MTAEYQQTPGETGNCYHFHCGVTGARFSTARAYHASTPQQELLLTWYQQHPQCVYCGIIPSTAPNVADFKETGTSKPEGEE